MSIRKEREGARPFCGRRLSKPGMNGPANNVRTKGEKNGVVDSRGGEYVQDKATATSCHQNLMAIMGGMIL